MGRPAKVPFEELVKMKKSGLNQTEIAKEVGCTMQNIAAHFKRHGGWNNPKFGGPKDPSSTATGSLNPAVITGPQCSRDHTIAEMARAGESDQVIAKKVGISHIRVCAAVGRMGLHAHRASVSIRQNGPRLAEEYA